MADAPTRTSIDDVTDDLLELVFLHVPSPTSLIRAAAVCKPWRRLIADARFLRRFHMLHRPAVAGYHFNKPRFCKWEKEIIYKPAFEPVASSTQLPAINARHFSLDFLSDNMTAEFIKPEIMDSRGSLLLMEFRGSNCNNLSHDFPGALVVCEPLTKRYAAIPRPWDFDASSCQYERSYLLDGGVADEAGDRIGMSNFRVLFELNRGNRAHATVFTAGGDMSSWSEKAIDDLLPVINYKRHVLGRAAGSWYFFNREHCSTTGVVLDGSTGEYSSFEMPNVDEDWSVHNKWNHRFYVTDDCDGKPCILSLVDTNLRVFTKRGGDNSDEWVLMNQVTLLETVLAQIGGRYEPDELELMNSCRYKLTLSMSTRATGFIILQLDPYESRFFSVDLKAMEVKLTKKCPGKIMYPSELPWPPALHTITDA
ncbi:hypothetical protein PR202_gb03350 [Eleusine coracana subsp. coracana]|uniref:F-box domain-containing protein n=1 Tax=Eleusine coracana subsp. coracana TaxID=191504 RepID=A0AAV5E0Z4_ELECO|nr:hypothetical protein PR202_gb03350 [Eleusine coracana subsp. coracana]